MQDTIEVQTTGPVSADDVEYARKRVAAALGGLSQPALFVRVRLIRFRAPALARPALAQVKVDLNGRVIRARAARETMTEAIDEVRDRLHARARRECDLRSHRDGRSKRPRGHAA